MQKGQSPIGRVKCVVDSCEFYQDGNYCMAKAIEIQPPDASNTQDTDCATFRPKGQM